MLRLDLQRSNSSLFVSACVFVCCFFFFIHGGDGRRREPDILQAGRTQIWNRLLCPGWFWRLRIRLCVRAPFPTLSMIKGCVFFFCLRYAVTPWVSTALAKPESGASGATPRLRRRPTVVSRDTRTSTRNRDQKSAVSLLILSFK